MKINKLAVAFFCITLIVCILCGCSPKTAITAEDFRAKLEAKNLTVVADNSIDAEGGEILVADDENFHIEFCKVPDNEDAENVFYYLQQEWDNEHTSKTMTTEVAAGKYNYYAFTADDDFHVLTRIDNTLLVCEGNKTHKEEILDLIEELGYK